MGSRREIRYRPRERSLMPLTVATHDGPFHADDVMAFALVRAFRDPSAVAVRTRDLAKIAAADLAVDVGGIYAPEAGRFDHHQSSYQGPLSAAGMVLEWLISTGALPDSLGERLRTGVMCYLDDVDNGRVAPSPSVPCFPRIVDALNQPASTHEQFDAAYLQAVAFAEAWLKGILAEHAKLELARQRVRAAMEEAARRGLRYLDLAEYLPWKEPYFEAGGADHPTDYVLHPGTDGSWRIVAIPPRLGSFEQKRPLPEAWAGLIDEALEAITGIEGSVFCHKNRFIAVFRTREAALLALERYDLARSGALEGDRGD